MGVAERYEEKKKNKTTSNYQGVEYRYNQKHQAESVRNSVVNRVNTWLKNNENYVLNAQDRFSGDNTAYRSDAADWLSTITTQKNNFDKEATSIKSYMDQNKDILGDEFIKTVTDALDGNLKVQGDILSASTEDMNFWSNWDSEDAYKKYLDDQATYEKRLNYNLEARGKDIEFLKNELSTIDSYVERSNQRLAELEHENRVLPYDNSKSKAEISAKMAENDKQIAAIKEAISNAYSKYGSKGELVEVISKAQRDYTLAERTQRADKLAAVARTDSEYYDPNFSNYAVVNEAFAENDDAYKYINDLNGFREDRNAYWQENAVYTDAQGNAYVNKLPWYIDGGYEDMNEDEIAIYNYYYNVGGREKANEYLESIEEHLQYRKGMREYGEMDTNVEKYLFAIYAGLDQFATNVANLFSSDTYMPTNSTQVTSGLIREDLGAGGKVVYDVLNTTSNMLPSILASTAVGMINPVAGQIVGAGLMASSAAGSAKAEMLNLGYTKEQANAYAAMVGIAEGGMEYLLGGISKLGGVLPDGLVGKILTKVDNAFARTAIQLGGSMLSEGFEEGLQTIIEPWLKEIATGVDFDDPKIDEILYSSLLGALSAGILEGGGTIASEVSTYKQGQTIKQTDGALDRLMTLGSTFSADTVAGELASKVNEKTGAYTVGRLLNEAGATLSEQNQSDIKAALVNSGMTEADATTVSKWLNKAVDGGIFTKRQVAALENNEVISKVFYDVIIKENSTVNQRNKAYSDLMSLADEVGNGNKVQSAEVSAENLSPEEIAQRISAVTGEDVGELLSRNEIQAKTASATENTSAEKAAKKGSYAVSQDGKTKVGDTEVSVKEVASVKDGNVVLRLEDGSTVNASDVEFGSDGEGILYDTVATSNMSAAAANAFINGYDGTVSADQYARGFREAYRYGEYGYPMREMSANGFSSYLTDIQKNLAYNLGKTDAKYRAESAQAKNGEAKSTKKGELHNTIQPKNERQKASLKTLGVLAKTLGIDIYTYESTAVDGVRREANGWYDPKDGSIHIDIHAGADGKGTMLFTVAHELTHHIRAKLPAKFKAFADFLFEQYGEYGVSVSELIAKRMKVLEANGRLNGMTEEQAHDLAYEEIVADACESMLADGEAVAKIAELKTKDKSLWQTIKDFFVNLVARIKAAYEGLEPDSMAGKETAKMLDVAEQLRAMWTEAVVEASEVNDNSKNEVKYSDGYSENSGYGAIRETLAKKGLDDLSVKLGNYFPLSASFDATMKADNNPLTMTTVKKGGVVLEKGKSAFTVARNTFRDTYGIKTAVHINQMGIDAVLYTDVATESISKAIEKKDGASEKTILDVIPYVKEILSNSILASVERIAHTGNKGTVLYGYRLYNLYWLEEDNKKTPHCLVCTVVQNTEHAEGYVFRDIENVTIDRGLPGKNTDMPAPVNDDTYTISQLYRFVKSVSRENGGIKYSAAEKNKYLFSYTKRNDGILYSDRGSMDSLLDERLATQNKLTELRKAKKEIEASEEYNSLVSKIVASDGAGMDSAIQEYNDWMSRSKYGDISDEIKSLEATYADLTKRYNEMAQNKAIDDERKNIEKSGLSESDYFRKQAIKEFGYTPYFYDAGYMLPNGKLLNFSGEKGKHFGDRGQDHRAIGTIYANVSGGKAMLKFMSEGNIRVMAETPGLDISSAVEPTSEQYSGIRKFVREYAKEGYLAVDITDEGGHVIGTYTYENNINDDRVVNDIKYYYKHGELREQSSIANFLYSDRDPDALSNRALLANALESATTNEDERRVLREYRSELAEADALEAELSEIRAKLKDLSFKRGPKDTEAIRKLKEDERKTINRIDIRDKKLLRLEAAKPIKDIIYREKQKAYKRAAQEGREALAMYRERSTRTQMRHKIKRVVSDLNKLLLHGTKERNVKLGLQEAVAAALDAINMDTVAADERVAKYNDLIAKATDPVVIASLTETRDRIQSQGDVLADKLEALRKAYAEIRNGEDKGKYPDYFAAEAKLIEDRIESVIKKVGNTPLRNMSYAQLEAVYDMYKMVLTTVRNANTVFKQGRVEDLQKNASAVMAELEAIPKLKEERLALGDTARGYLWNELTPYYAFERIGSKTFTDFYWEAVRGQNTYANDVNEANEFSTEARKKHNYKSWDMDKIHEFTLGDGRVFRVSLKHMLSIYAYSKREQAAEHMRSGGFFFNDKETFRRKGKVLEMVKSNEAGYKIDDATLDAIKSTLTAEQKAYVDEMQAYLTEMGEKGNEVTRVLWGIDLFKEKIYFPLKSSKDFIFQANQTAQEASLKNDGMTKETVPGASNPIVLEAFDEVWASHVNRMSQYHAFVIPIENLNKIHNYGTWANSDAASVSTMLRARYSEAVNEYLTQFIQDLNGVKKSQGGVIPFLSGMFTKFKKTAVAGSLSVMVQQPTAILRAQGILDAKYFVGMPSGEKLSTKWEEVKKYAPIAIIKEIGGFDAGSGRQINEWLNADTQTGLKKAMSTVDEVAMWGAAKGDQLGWCAIWEAVKRETVHTNPNLRPGSDEFLKAVGERFTEIIVKTQVYDSTLSRSGYMRSKNELTKMMTAFMGEPTLSANILLDSFLQARRGTITKSVAARRIGATYLAILAAGLAKSAIYALRDDEDDESYLEKYLQALSGSLASDINPLTMLPGVKDIISVFDGWEIERTDMALFQDLKNAIDGLGSESKSTWKKIEDFAGAFAAFFGLPVKNLMRTGRELYNGYINIVDGITGGKLGAALVEGVTGKGASKGESIYAAIVNGDKARLDVYKSGYKTEDAYNVAVRKALRENDSRIKEAAEARYSGDSAKYERLVREIVKEGHFSQDLVVGAVNTELNDLRSKETKAEEEEKTEKVTSLYSTYDLEVAFKTGKTDRAVAVIDDLIKTKVANGMEEKAAKSSVKSSVTSYWKPLYKAAAKAKNEAEKKRIREILKASGLYGSASDIVKTANGWLKEKD